MTKATLLRSLVTVHFLGDLLWKPSIMPEISKGNLIILVNDNQMSIAENHGGLYRNLAELRATNGQAENNFFKTFGLDYKYLENGNDIESLIHLFEEVKDIDHPIVLHIHTEKGRGYQPALENKEAFHWHMPFGLETGQSKVIDSGKSYSSVMLDYMDKKVSEGLPLLPSMQQFQESLD